MTETPEQEALKTMPQPNESQNVWQAAGELTFWYGQNYEVLSKALTQADVWKGISDGKTDIIRQLEVQAAAQKDALDKARGALMFYKNMENYLANLYPDKPEFNFKETPVHNDGGDKAREAISAIDAIQQKAE